MTRRLLRERCYSLQANAKTTEGGQHLDRDAQFAYLNDQATDHLATGEPVISVDTKKELVGSYKCNGREWHPQGEPEQVKVHDFIDNAAAGGHPITPRTVNSVLQQRHQPLRRHRSRSDNTGSCGTAANQRWGYRKFVLPLPALPAICQRAEITILATT